MASWTLRDCARRQSKQTAAVPLLSSQQSFEQQVYADETLRPPHSERNVAEHLRGALAPDRDDDVPEGLGPKPGFAVREIILPTISTILKDRNDLSYLPLPLEHLDVLRIHIRVLPQQRRPNAGVKVAQEVLAPQAQRLGIMAANVLNTVDD